MKMKKEALIEALEAKLPEAKRIDAERLREHKRNNKEIARARRQWARDLVKLPDDTLAEKSFWDLRDAIPQGSSCPTAIASELEAIIRRSRMDYRRVIDTSARNAERYNYFLNLGEPSENARVC